MQPSASWQRQASWISCGPASAGETLCNSTTIKKKWSRHLSRTSLDPRFSNRKSCSSTELSSRFVPKQNLPLSAVVSC